MVKRQRDRIIEMVFETLEADQFQFSDSIQNVLSSEGLQTGIVLDIGEINC